MKPEFIWQGGHDFPDLALCWPHDFVVHYVFFEGAVNNISIHEVETWENSRGSGSYFAPRDYLRGH